MKTSNIRFYIALLMCFFGILVGFCLFFWVGLNYDNPAQARSQPYSSGWAAYYPGGVSKFDSFTSKS